MARTGLNAAWVSSPTGLCSLTVAAVMSARGSPCGCEGSGVADALGVGIDEGVADLVEARGTGLLLGFLGEVFLGEDCGSAFVMVSSASRISVGSMVEATSSVEGVSSIEAASNVEAASSVDGASTTEDASSVEGASRTEESSTVEGAAFFFGLPRGRGAGAAGVDVDAALLRERVCRRTGLRVGSGANSSSLSSFAWVVFAISSSEESTMAWRRVARRGRADIILGG